MSWREDCQILIGTMSFEDEVHKAFRSFCSRAFWRDILSASVFKRIVHLEGTVAHILYKCRLHGSHMLLATGRCRVHE